MLFRFALLVGAVLVMLSVSVSSSQTLALVEGYFVNKAGEPLAHQPVIIEGKRQVPKWLWWSWGPKTEQPIKVIGVTDANGFVQVVDLPAGDYTLKLASPGVEPVAVKQITLPPSYTNVKFKAAGETQTNSLDPYPPEPSINRKH